MNVKNFKLFAFGVVFGCGVGFIVLAFVVVLSNLQNVKPIVSTNIPTQGVKLIATEPLIVQAQHSASTNVVRTMTALAPHSTTTPKPTIAPTSTPIPSLGTIRNPVPLGQKLSLSQGGIVGIGGAEFDVSVLSVIRGQDAWNKIYSANQFNDPAPDGMEYIIAEIQVNHTGNDSQIIEMNSIYWKTVSNKRYFDGFTSMVCCLSPSLDISLGSGGEGIGILGLPIFVNDDNPMLVFADKFYFLLK